MNSDEPISEADYKWRVTRTDGVAVSSYAFDDFGRNIDPRTGKQKKHGYTTDGNIIQPFVFTGYQEDEVSGLKFAQARFYDANTGRFQSEDNVKGFMTGPFTQNHYTYSWNSPIVFADYNGLYPVEGAHNSVSSGVANSNSSRNTSNGVNTVVSSSCSEDGGDSTTVKDANEQLSNYLSLIEFAGKYISKYKTGRLSEIAKELENLPKLGKRANPAMKNSVYASLLVKEAANCASEAKFFTRLSEAAKSAGDIFTGFAIGIDVFNGVQDNIKSKASPDEFITDAAIDASMTYAEISVATELGSLAAGTIGVGVGTLIASATGCALAAAAAPVVIGVGVGIAVGWGLTKVCDDIKMPNGKTVRENVKDTVHNTMEKAGELVSDGWDAVTSWF